MRIRGHRRDAAAPPPLPAQGDSSGAQPPPLPPRFTDARAESPRAQPDESSNALRDRIYHQPFSHADAVRNGKAQVEEMECWLCSGSSHPELESETQAGGFLSHAEDEEKQAISGLFALRAADHRTVPDYDLCSDEDSLVLQSDECKKVVKCSFTGDGPVAVGHASTSHESKAIPERSKQGKSIPRSGRGKKRSLSALGVEISNHFALQKPTRHNNYHWTSDEVNQLVDGVATLGHGRWTEIKSAYFSTSIRTAQHLKDKWRNLLIACGVHSKKKVLAPRVTQNLKDRIISLHRKHVSIRKRSASRV